MRSRIVMIVALLGLIFSGCTEQFDERYPTREAALQQNGSDEWFLGLLPASVHAIVERHDIDTNDVWGTFQFDPVEGSHFNAYEVVEGPELDSLRIRPPRGVDWWPRELSGALKSEVLRSRGLRMLKLQGSLRHDRAGPREVYFAINPASGVGYYWESGS